MSEILWRIVLFFFFFFGKRNFRGTQIISKFVAILMSSIGEKKNDKTFENVEIFYFNAFK